MSAKEYFNCVAFERERGERERERERRRGRAWVAWKIVSKSERGASVENGESEKLLLGKNFFPSVTFHLRSRF